MKLRTSTRWWAVAGIVLLLVWVAPAAAQKETARTRAAAAAPRLDNPYTYAELGVGILTLPTTDICLTQPGTCTKGDTNPYGWVWMLYRVTGDFAIGAGTSYARSLSSDTTLKTPTVERSHTRNYMLLDFTGRYYGLRLSDVEGWLGTTVGGAVISDQYDTVTESSDAVILGPSGVVVRTEGLSAGLSAGIGWSFARNWSLETSFRTAWWFLPSEKACGPTGDCATLSEDVPMFSLGIGVGYQISL